jgi:hypothetical protein
MSDVAARCPSEEELLQAMSSEEWPQLSKHIEGCSACQSLLAITEAIRHDIGLAQREAQLPSAQWIIFQAEIRRHRDAAARVTLPLERVGRFAFVAGLVVILAALYSVGSAVFGNRGGLSPGSGATSQPAGLLIAVAAVPVMLLVTIVLQILWTED